ncbi:hypothetical protein GGI35DRAFT_462566 [Trichoderma velutinum]
MLHGRLGFSFGIVDGPLGGSIRLERTWREDKVSRRIQEGQLRYWIGHSVREVYARFITEHLAWSYGVQIRSTDKEDGYFYSENSLFGIALTFVIQIRVGVSKHRRR